MRVSMTLMQKCEILLRRLQNFDEGKSPLKL